MSKFIDPESKAAILYSLALPLHYIVYDGEQYWMVYGSGTAAPWANRKPYKGHTHHLKLCMAYTKMLIPDLPFMPGYGTPETAHCNWGEVRA